VNTNELEDAIRAELRAEVRQAPAGAPTKAAVLQAVTGLPMDPGVRRLRHWTVPLLAAAAVVLVAVGLTVGARSLTSSRPGHPSRPNQPLNQQQQLTPPPPNGVTCSAARGETLVNGLQTSYTVSASGERRYVFEYYCAGSDGHRTGSSVQVFKLVNGRLQYLAETVRAALGNVVLSLSGGGEDGFRVRDANLISSILPFYGAVVDESYLIDGDDGNFSHLLITGGGSPVAQACRTTDLAVRVASAQQPTPHSVLQLTNRSKVECALWGNPHYTPQDAGKQLVSYLLRGPAGGVTSAPSAPVVLLQPGATAGASIGSNPSTGSCAATTYRITLPDGVDLGLHDLALCEIVSYPLVPRAGGDAAADYPTTVQPSQPSSCVDDNQLLLSANQASTQSGDGAGLVFTIKLLDGQPCTLSGYPTVRAVDSAGKAVQAASDTPRGTLGGLAAGSSKPPGLTLQKGQSVSAMVEWAAAAYTPTSHCSRDVRISLTFGATGFTPNPAIGQVCDLTVHPWVAGTTGSQ
jgi:hypothetical protein